MLYLKGMLDVFLKNLQKSHISSQSALTCTKLTIETLEQGVKYVQS